MPEITLTFENDINISAQVGDIIYYCAIQDLGGFDISTNGSNINDNLFEVGPISNISVSTNTIVCSPTYITPTTKPPTGSFILFSKDNSVNMVSPLGYYAKARFINDSIIKGEMFSAACEIFGSSK